MLGAIIGDIVGSVYEWDNIKTKDFPLFSPHGFFTDDSVMTFAIAKTILKGGNLEKGAVRWMRELGNRYPGRGYGGRFLSWLETDDPQPYNSWGNGSAMRISPVGLAARSKEEVKEMSLAVTRVTHDHPEGLKGAEAAAMSIFLLKSGVGKDRLAEIVNDEYYDMDFTLDEIRDGYSFDVSCMGTLPVAIKAFLESTGFEDAIRNAISIGGDSDTIAAITGGLAEAFYGIPDSIRADALEYLPDELRGILDEFESRYM